MRTLRFGGSDLEVSALALGCMEMGTRIPEEESFAVLDAYRDAGGRFLDTANNYAFWIGDGRGGESEKVLGEWMRARGARDEMVVATKVGAQPTVPGTSLETAEGLGARAIREAAEGSLRRLGIEQIDLYYAHVDDVHTPMEEPLRAFEDLRAAGKVREIACSNHEPHRVAEALAVSATHGWQPYRGLQQRMSYLIPDQAHDLGVQKVCDLDTEAFLAAHPGLTLVTYSAMLGGAYDTGRLPDGYDTPANLRRLDAVRGVSRALGVTPGQVVLAWLLRRPGTVPLVATSSPDRLREQMDALTVALDDASMMRLDEVRDQSE